MLGVKLDPAPLFTTNNPDYELLFDAVVQETWKAYKAFNGIKD